MIPYEGDQLELNESQDSFIPLDLPENLKAQLQGLQRETDTEAIDYAKFREASLDHWEDLLDGTEDHFPEILTTLLRKSSLLPRFEFQEPIVLSYLSLASALCTRVPILYSSGETGSGKSQLGKLLCAIHGTTPISAGSTFVSLRNDINALRYYDPEMGDTLPGNERNMALVWEDIQSNELRKYDGAMFALFKNGVERSGTIKIGGEKGKNLVFKVFSPKCISSIHPIYAEFEFRELIRRVIVIEHKKFDKWVGTDFKGSERLSSPQDLINIDDISWDGLKGKFEAFWRTRSNLQAFTKFSRSLRSYRSHGIPDALYKMSKDLIATGLTCGYWLSVEEACAHMRQYWTWHKENIERQSSATQKVLERFIAEKVGGIELINQRMIDAGTPNLQVEVEIEPSQLKTYVDMCRHNGELDTNGNVRDVNEAMASLGWKLMLNKRGQTRWMKVAQ